MFGWGSVVWLLEFGRQAQGEAGDGESSLDEIASQLMGHRLCHTQATWQASPCPDEHGAKEPPSLHLTALS